MTHDSRSVDPQSPELHQAFSRDGYLILEGAVPQAPLAELNKNLLATFEAEQSAGRLFEGGGLISGHLNCFPGRESRFVYDTLLDRGVIDLVRALSPQAQRLPNIGCNMNLPGSHPQNRHMDGYAAAPFAIINIATVDTDLGNGAMEMMPATHQKAYKYWELVLEQPRAIRPALKRGDVIIRSSMLWHRGMPNLSARPRPMLALTWEDGGSTLEDPWAQHGGKIAFFPNRYQPTRLGRLKERAFIAAPSINSTLRFVRSFF